MSLYSLFPVWVGAGDCGHHWFPGDHVADVPELQGETQRKKQKQRLGAHQHD